VDKFNIKNVNNKFIVTVNSVPLIPKDQCSANKITEFVSLEDAKKYVEIMKMLEKRKTSK
jgi:hypothetical protein